MKINLNDNPAGVEKIMAEQTDREQKGTFVRVDDKTRIFVRSGRDPRKAIAMYKQKNGKQKIQMVRIKNFWRSVKARWAEIDLMDWR